jgi:hypothetical protein
MKRNNLCYLIAMMLLLFGCSKNQLNKNQPNVGDASIALPSAPGDVVGKVTVGYQGWFSAAGDGSPINNWAHQNHETWPEMSEYTTTYTNIPFSQGGTTVSPAFNGNLGNGQPARMYSPYDQSTVDTHFRWMQQYGIDCAALQRFANEITPGSTIKAQRDGMAVRVKNAAQTYGRKFYIMYDASGWGNLAAMQTDWTNTIVGTLNLTASSAYAKQNGKPVVCVYGLGYASHPSNAADALAFINWLKAQGLYVIGSVPGQWRTGTGDAKSTFGSVWPAFNMISAWAVGRVVDASYTTWVTGDLAYCNANGMDYQPCAYPGTAFYNTNGNTGSKNQFKRMHGDFMWSQFAVMKNAGAVSVYIAMFDETNEATSIFKCAEDASQIPAGKYFLTLDADGTHVSSDFYLRETGDGGKMFKGLIPYTATCPTPFTVSGGGGPANGTYKIINRNSGQALDAKSQLTANGTPIQQWGYGATANQKWILTSLGSGQYQIMGVQSGRSLDVTGQSLIDGAKLQLYDYNGGNNQKWILTATSGGYYTIKGVQSNKFVEVAGSSTTAGALVQQWASTGANNQQWAFQTP